MMPPTEPPKKGSIRNQGSSGSGGSSSGGNGGQAVKFARRTSSGRYVTLSREDIDMSGDYTGDYMNYTVHIPPTPDRDNQPTESSSVAAKAEEQYVSNSLFTGGFNSVTRAHLMDKVTDSDSNQPDHVARGKAGFCQMPVCDGETIKDDRGNRVYPCECRYLIRDGLIFHTVICP